MSETFLIKSTTFSSADSPNDKAAKSFIIGPGELNGPSGLARNSDLRLYGIGSLKWGEGVNENLFRILENNACAQKELNDYNPATQTFDYDPVTDPILPKDENDLGIGNGITVPITGQNWYNVTTNLNYSWTGSLWKTIVNDDGSLTLAGVLDMSLERIINVGTPDDNPNTVPGSLLSPKDVMPVDWADIRYINASGDQMDGDLEIGNGAQLIIYNNIPSTPYAVGNRGYNDDKYVKRQNGDTMTGSLAISNNFSVYNGITTLGTTTIISATISFAEFSSTPTVNGDDVWHKGNAVPGTSTGLDADTLDGLHAVDIALASAYPVGSIYISALASFNPSTVFGGSWLPFGQGRMMVGFDATDPLFDQQGETGGSKDSLNIAHTHTMTSTGSHKHIGGLATDYATAYGTVKGSNSLQSHKNQWNVDNHPYTNTTGSHAHTVNTAGASGTNRNLPPYIVTYMWQRTA